MKIKMENTLNINRYILIAIIFLFTSCQISKSKMSFIGLYEVNYPLNSGYESLKIERKGTYQYKWEEGLSSGEDLGVWIVLNDSVVELTSTNRDKLSEVNIPSRKIIRFDSLSLKIKGDSICNEAELSDNEYYVCGLKRKHK